MKKTLTLSGTDRWQMRLVQLKSWSMKPVECLSRLYSKVLEEEVSPKQTLVLLNLQLSVLFMVFSAGGTLTFRILCCCWMAWSVRNMKQNHD